MPDEKTQFRVLFRSFLFRAVDLELLSPQSDLSKLLGQFAALLIFIGLLFSFSTIALGDSKLPREALLMSAWGIEHLLISTSMLVVGLFAVLSWDSVFPDRRDVLVLGPLPVRIRILFLAKITAIATALGVTIFSLNIFTGLALPLALAPSSSSLLDLVFSSERYRLFAAYWLTMIAAGIFVFCSVLVVQGIVVQLLPRRQFLKLSAFLQMAAFCLFICMYFLPPSFKPESSNAVIWVPSYWFLGFFQQLNGSMQAVMIPLVQRAWVGLISVLSATAVVYTISYFRTLRKIVEEPDILPGSHDSRWLPQAGDLLSTAIVQFSIRALMRSRQHRVTLAFYLGAGFSLAILFMKTPHARMMREADTSLIFSSLVMTLTYIMGIRIVLSIPFNLRGNWIFRLTEIHSPGEYIRAIQQSLLTLTGIPVMLLSVVFFLAVWPWSLAARHLIVLGLWNASLCLMILLGFQKIPFTCSWQPGKSQFHLLFLASLGGLLLIGKGAAFEQHALESTSAYLALVLMLCAAVVAARWIVGRTELHGPIVQFEDEPPAAILQLGLYRDGVLPSQSTSEKDS